jgi:hypothetical protein
MRAVSAMVIDFKPAGEPGTRAEFSYHLTPATISITGKGRLSAGKNLEAGFAQNRILASSPYHHIQHHGPAWPGRLARRSVGWQNGNLFSIE